MDIAIIGAGVSGLTAAYLLRHRHRVQIFEASHYAGGHANTVMVPGPEGEETPLDVGFIVYNERTYPGFTRLLRELGVETRRSEMSFSVRFEDDGFEFSSRGVRGFFAQPRNALRLAHWRLLLDIVRFQRDARRALRRGSLKDISFGEYLDRQGYARAFRERVIVPLLASTWSNSPASILGFPAHYLFTFLETHGVLALDSIPEWRWIRGGARTYVHRMLSVLPEGSLHLATPIVGVTRHENSVAVDLGGGDERSFDAVVVACHADQARVLLRDADEDEAAALAGLRYEPTHVVLHTDERLLPRSPRARAAWNYHARTSAGPEANTLTMTYDLNRLQGFGEPRGDVQYHAQYCVSTNPGDAVDPGKVLAEFDYSHPVYSRLTLESQERLRGRNGTRRTYFAGAYLGYGFHEDGLQSGVDVARLLGVEW